MNSARIRYKCGNCRYEFTRKKGMDVDKCPYCSKSGNLKIQGNFASEIIDEVTGYDRMDE